MISGPYSISAHAVVDRSLAQLSFGVTVHNTSAAPIDVEFGGCWAFVHLYANEARRGAPAYDETTEDLSCVAAARRLTLAPADSGVFNEAIGLQSLKLKGIKAGHYWASVLTSLNGTPAELPAGEVDIQF